MALSGSTGSERVDIRGAERFAAYCPISALELVDADPGDRPHIFTLHLYHGLCHLRDQLLLLGWCEHVFDYIDRNEWHLMTLQ
jgi:N-dimethylarginine dimethylaminohydrolase